MPATNQLYINVDTTFNSIWIIEGDFNTTGEIIFDYLGKIGQPVQVERSNNDALFRPTCQLKFHTLNGATGFFLFSDVYNISIDGVSIGAAGWDDVIALIGQYLFATVGGAGIPTSTITWQFQNSPHQNNQFARMGFDGSVSVENLHNVAANKIHKNNVVVSAPFSFVKDDEIYVEITRTNPAHAAHMEWVVTGINAPLTYQSQHYYWPRTFKYKENVSFPNDFTHGISVQGTGNTASFQTNLIYDNPVSAGFNVVFEPAHWNFTGQLTFGLNDQSGSNTPVNRYPRMRYCIMLDANAVKIWEFGVLKTTITLAYNQMMHFRIYSKYNNSTGVYDVYYYYSVNNMTSWTLIYTSLNTHNGTTLFYGDFATQGGYYAKFRAPLLQQL